VVVGGCEKPCGDPMQTADSSSGMARWIVKGPVDIIDSNGEVLQTKPEGGGTAAVSQSIIKAVLRRNASWRGFQSECLKATGQPNLLYRALREGEALLRSVVDASFRSPVYPWTYHFFVSLVAGLAAEAA